MISVKLKRVLYSKEVMYHVVVVSTVSSRKKFIEKIGYYKPIADYWDNKYLFIDMDKLLYWLCRGASTSKKLFMLTKPLVLFYQTEKIKNVVL